MTDRPYGHGQRLPWASQRVLTEGPGGPAPRVVGRAAWLSAVPVGQIDGPQPSETDPGQDGAVSHPASAILDRPAIPMTKADQFRKRAEVLGKRLRPSQVQKTSPIGRKQKALLDLADNEDWLNGIKAEKVRSAMPSA